MVAGLDELQPRAQRGLRAVQELANAEGRKDLQAKVGQRPAEDHAEQLLLGRSENLDWSCVRREDQRRGNADLDLKIWSDGSGQRSTVCFLGAWN